MGRAGAPAGATRHGAVAQPAGGKALRLERRRISSNAVEVYIHGLRKKLGADVIRNVRGVGYMVPRA
jgi:hypothetical protein